GVGGIDRDPTNRNWGVQTLWKQTQIMHPSERILWVEESDTRGDNLDYWVFKYDQPDWGDKVAAFHGSGSSFNFADGHAENRRWLSDDTVGHASSTANYIDDWRSAGHPKPAVDQDIQWLLLRYACVANP